MKAATPTRGPGRPRRGSRPDSRAALLAAASTTFAEAGFRGATIDQIVERAGLSKGTFYWNFAGKEDIFLTLLEERIDGPVQELVRTIGSTDADADVAEPISTGLAALLSTERELVLLLHEYWATAVRDRAVAKRYRRRSEALRSTLAEALTARHVQTGVPLTMRAEDLATAFIALSLGLSQEALVTPGAVGVELFGEIASLVYDGFVHRSQSS